MKVYIILAKPDFEDCEPYVWGVYKTEAEAEKEMENAVMGDDTLIYEGGFEV